MHVPRGDAAQTLANEVLAEIPHIRLEWLAFPAFAVALALVHGMHAQWAGPAAVGLTGLMLGCVAWAGLEQAAGERRRQRCAELVAENGVLITVHEVDGAEAKCIERLLHDSGAETISQNPAV